MIKSPSRFFLQATWICHANFLCFHEILKFLLILSLEDLEPHLSVMARNVFPAAAAAKSLQSCPTLCDPIDRSPPGSSIPGILQARILEWVAISFSNAWKQKVKVKLFSRAWLLLPHGLQPTKLLCPWDFPGKSTGVGRHCLLRTSSQNDTKIPPLWNLYLAPGFAIILSWFSFNSTPSSPPLWPPPICLWKPSWNCPSKINPPCLCEIVPFCFSFDEHIYQTPTMCWALC